MSPIMKSGHKHWKSRWGAVAGGSPPALIERYANYLGRDLSEGQSPGVAPRPSLNVAGVAVAEDDHAPVAGGSPPALIERPAELWPRYLIGGQSPGVAPRPSLNVTTLHKKRATMTAVAGGSPPALIERRRPVVVGSKWADSRRG